MEAGYPSIITNRLIISMNLVLGKRSLLTVLLLGTLGLLPVSISAQEMQQSLYEAGLVAWDQGDYPDAIRAFQKVLESERGDAYLEGIALLTGELYTTREIAVNGTNPQWGVQGHHLTYEDAIDGSMGTRVLDVSEGMLKEVATLDGRQAHVLDENGMAYYLRVNRNEAFNAAMVAARPAERPRTYEAFMKMRAAQAAVEAQFTDIVVKDLASSDETIIPTPGLDVYEMLPAANGDGFYIIAGRDGDQTRRDVFELKKDGTTNLLSDYPGRKSDLVYLSKVNKLVFGIDDTSFAVLNLETGDTVQHEGATPVVSVDETTIAFKKQDDETNMVYLSAENGEETLVFSSDASIENLAISPNGSHVVFQMMPRENQELFVASADSSWQLTHEIQHDLFPRFIGNDTVFAVIGEGRHRRSYLYDVLTGDRTRVFHNNTIRTVAPEYQWAVSPDGAKVAIVSERDGDTISPERGLYLVDLKNKISKEGLEERLTTMLEAELALREKGSRLYEQIADRVEEVVEDVSTSRVYGYESDLFKFGSKFITEPGNAKAIAYLADKLRSFGYEPELQWFEPREGIRTANVIAKLEGTVNPELIYAVSSHFDSVQRGPGADDNTSGTAALLEAARVLAQRPQPATIHFAFFTGEEAGLLGSREYVRRAVERGDQLVGALNNDMVGYTNNNRLDNTIRYSNEGIRDIQHAAAFLFTDMITYDAKYYKSTDAHAYYEAYGDIVGGIGSYPILGNPHYHQTHDVLETVNHQLVAEVSKTTVATLMLLASSPSRLKELTVERKRRKASVAWAPAVESNVDRYLISYGPEDGEWTTVESDEPMITLNRIEAGWKVAVKAVNEHGLESWDWAVDVIE